MWRKSKILKTKTFIACIKAEDIYADIVEDTEKRFDPSNYELVKPLPKGNSKKIIGFMRDELGERNLRKNHVIISYIDSKNMQLFNRKQQWR